jgi:hypothetical protein
VADAGQAAVFLNLNVVIEVFIPLPEFQRNKTHNPTLIPDLSSAFLAYFACLSLCKKMLLVL